MFSVLAIICLVVSTILMGGAYVLMEIQKNRDKEDLINEVRTNKGVIADYKEENVRLIRDQLNIYRNTLEQWAAKQIPPPPEFLQQQQQTLSNLAKDTEEWAKSISKVKGMEKEKHDLEKLALEARAAELDAKLRPYLLPVVSTFKEVTAALNKEKAFGGDIKLEVFEIKNPIVTISTEYAPGGRSKQPFLSVSFSKGGVWHIELLSLLIRNNESTKGVNIALINSNIGFSLFVEENGKYTFQPRGDSLKGWPEQLMGKSGDVKFLHEVVKCIFQRELSLNYNPTP